MGVIHRHTAAISGILHNLLQSLSQSQPQPFSLAIWLFGRLGKWMMQMLGIRKENHKTYQLLADSCQMQISWSELLTKRIRMQPHFMHAWHSENISQIAHRRDSARRIIHNA